MGNYDPFAKLLDIEIFEIKLGLKVKDAIGSNNCEQLLLEEYNDFRSEIVAQYGVIPPELKITLSTNYKDNEYRLLFRGIDIGGWEIKENCVLGIIPSLPNKYEINKPIVIEPAFGAKSVWLSYEEAQEAKQQNVTTVDVANVILVHTSEWIKNHLHEILTYEQVKWLVKKASLSSPNLINDLIPSSLKISKLYEILTDLLEEKISIRDMICILESIAYPLDVTNGFELLVDIARNGLSKCISSNFAKDGIINAIVLDDALSAEFENETKDDGRKSCLISIPNERKKIITDAIKQAVEDQVNCDNVPLIITDMSIRRKVNRFVKRFIPDINIVSYNEIADEFSVDVFCTVSAAATAALLRNAGQEKVEEK